MALFIGMLSGTSMDGIDIALVDCDQHSVIHSATYPYDETLLAQITEIASGKKISIGEMARLHRVLGYVFSEACKDFLHRFALDASDITAIGCHGQTVYHEPNDHPSCSVQLACPQTIAFETGIQTIADFRTADIVAGGQGAPLAPLYHQVLFSSHPKPLAVVNIGGISNISVLNDNGVVLGFDSGPGNSLMDAWIHRHLNIDYDHEGQWARQGQCQNRLLDIMLSEPFFQMAPPKSLDKYHFSVTWLESKINNTFKPEDVQATLCHLTAKTIAEAITVNAVHLKEVICCGGGAKNRYLLELIQTYLPGCAVRSSDDLSIDSLYVEAMLFAWLARQRLDNHAHDLSKITGVKHPQCLGVIYSAQSQSVV